MSLLRAMMNRHWAIVPDDLRRMIQIAQRRNPPIEAVEAELGEKLENSHETTVRGGVAVLNVCGPLFRHANMFTRVSGATSYEVLAQDLKAALDSRDVDAVVLNIDSPGGEVTGCSELADMIYAARGRKPLVAYVDGMACSAAYWIASACDRIVAHDTAIVGSIGVVSTIVDTSKADEAAGVEEAVVVSSGAPEKRHGYDGITDEAVAELQRTLDALESVFVGRVARNRDVSARTVRTEYGRGGTFVAGAATRNAPTGLDAGLVDAIGSFESTLAAIGAKRSSGGAKALRSKTSHSRALAAAKEPSMPENEEMSSVDAKLDCILKKLDEHSELHEAAHTKLDAIHRLCSRLGAEEGGDDAEGSAEYRELFAKLGVSSLDAAKGAIEGLLAAQTQVAAANQQLLRARLDAAASGAKPTITPAQKSKLAAALSAGEMSAEGLEQFLRFAQPVLAPASSEAQRPAVDTSSGGQGLSAAALAVLKANGYSDEQLSELTAASLANAQTVQQQEEALARRRAGLPG